MPLPDGFPPAAGPARNAAILSAAHAGSLEYDWAPVLTSFHEHTATFMVTRDGVKLGGVRLAGCATLCQMIADAVNACLPTPRLLDEAWLQATTQIAPQTISPVASSSAAMVEHSAKIDVAAAGATGLVMPIGKPWVLAKDTSPAKAALYGWQSATPIPGVGKNGLPSADVRVKSPATPGVWVIQGLSTRHDPGYADYSSSIWLVSRSCVVDGEPRDLVDILRSPELAPLCSHEGALTSTRQPGVPLPPEPRG